jgi:two-component system, OmpR family, phosphate regulon sensor histidine kinase PhoR
MKKMQRQGYLALFTFAALVILMTLQVLWLFQTARLEEQRFNQKVTEALKEARKEIGQRAPSCNKMMNYLCGEQCPHADQMKSISEVDSIIKIKLSDYNISLAYTFEITDSLQANHAKLFGPRCYLQSLNGLLEKDGIQIRLLFPNRNQFILEQIKGTFLLAIFSILFVGISFLITFQMFTRERKMLEQTTHFINNLVHEFQTPLSNIRLATGLIRKRETASRDEKIGEYTGVILKENQKLQNHVEEILKVSNSGWNNTPSDPVNVHDSIRSVVDDFLHKLDAVDGVIKLDLKAPHPVITADEKQFALVLSNLIDNAIKYSLHKPLITLSTHEQDQNLIIKVADNGIGIEKGELAKIFDRYYRVATGDIHNVKGFGLGLTFVKQKVESFNGKIKVISHPGKGSTFILSLPTRQHG